MIRDPFEVDIAACRSRQQRLLAEMQRLGLDWFLATRSETVQWLTGAYVGPLFSPAAALDSNGWLILVLPARKKDITIAADEVLPYEEKWHSTLRDEQRIASNAVLLAALPSRLKNVGGEWTHLGPDVLAACDGVIANVESVVFGLRRQKDTDEVKMLRRALDANRVMYAAAREIVAPGINELDVYNALQAAAVKELGEPLTYFGQDFRCNARGGAPRNRAAQAGELYILDLGVGFRGYYSDNCRTIAVGGSPTDKQMEAWRAVSEVFAFVESYVKPGASCQQLFNEVQTMLDRKLPWVFNHHLGHGVGLAPQEGPHLNPYWDDIFAVGDFIAVEPGLYHEQDLRLGLRLEQNYLVTADGIEKLTDYPLGL
jgi:Xaa-Pro aminopeptidase